MTLADPTIETVTATPAAAEESVIQNVAAELRRRFERSGCMARMGDFARLFPRSPVDAVTEALHRLCEEQIAEIGCLSDGGLVFQFPRR